MARVFSLPFKDFPIVSLPLFAAGFVLILLCKSQFEALLEGNNPEFLFGLMMFGPACMFAVSFITTFSPELCKSHLKAYVALITGVEIGIAINLGYAATRWYVLPEKPHLEPTVVSLTLIIGCLQWSKSKWESRVNALLEEKKAKKEKH